jgi:hypothetical protein
MQDPIPSNITLQKAVQLLEEEQKEKGLELKAQFQVTYESVKPINLLKDTLQEINAAPAFRDQLIGTAIGFAAGFVAKKIVESASKNQHKEEIAAIVQVSITQLIVSNPDAIRFVGSFLFGRKKKAAESSL